MWERPSGWRSHFTEQESEACSVSPLPRPRHLFCFWRRPSSWPRGAGRQEGRPELEPEPEPKSVQLPTVWNPGGARSRVRMCPTTHRGAGRAGRRPRACAQGCPRGPDPDSAQRGSGPSPEASAAPGTGVKSSGGETRLRQGRCSAARGGFASVLEKPGQRGEWQKQGRGSGWAVPEEGLSEQTPCCPLRTGAF